MHLITTHETLQNSLKILIKIRSKTLSKLSRSPSSSPPNDRGIFTPEGRPLPLATLHTLAHASPHRWSTICHQVAGFPIFRPISPRRHWYLLPSASLLSLFVPPLPPRHAPAPFDASRRDDPPEEER